MPDTLIGFRAHDQDLELIEFVAGKLKIVEDLLPAGLRTPKISRQDVLRHCLAVTAGRYHEAAGGQGQVYNPGDGHEPPSYFGNTNGIGWQGHGAYCYLERTRNGRFCATATWLEEEQEAGDERYVRYFAPRPGESLNDTMLRAQQWCREVTKQAYARPRVTADEPDNG